MKKTRALFIVLSLVTMVCCFFVLASCGQENDGDNTNKLTVPVVELKGDTVIWSADASASKFEISVNRVRSYVENTVTSITLTRGQSFKIRAIGDGIESFDSDWSKSIVYMTSNLEMDTTHTVTWKNGNDVLEVDENVPYGTVPRYNGEAPVKESDVQYSYIFKGWSPEISPVTGDVTYEAQFESKVNTYSITFYSEDGSELLYKATVPYGETAVYNGLAPVKSPTVSSSYVFNGWLSEKGGSKQDDLANVVSDRVVYASFKEIIKKVSVFITSNNTDYGKVSLGSLDGVEYGTSIEVKGNQITIGENTITAITTANNSQYTYKFASWETEKTVGSNTVITAKFTCEVNTYTVTWKNGNDVIEVDENVPYGTVPKYNGATPTKNASGNVIYTFSGWSPAVFTVTGDVTYEAQFSSAENNHVVIFYDEDGITELGRAIVAHGGTATYPNALPIKAPTAQTIYTFEKWVLVEGGAAEASLSNITEDKAVYAKYSSSVRKYTVIFCDYDGAIISQSEVEYGGSAVSPANPKREGYRFDKWDKTFSNITSELTVRATYIQQFKVTFLDYDDSVIDIQVVDYNGSATSPESPTRNNYRFKGWSAELSNVKHDLTIKAEYIRQYKVTFYDYDKKAIKTVTVDDGSIVEPPSASSKVGYTFAGWYYDDKYAQLSHDTIVVNDSIAEIVDGASIISIWGKWTQNNYTVIFDAKGGSVSSANIVVAYDSTYGVLPTPTKTGHTFSGWYLNGTQIKSTTIVKTAATHTLEAKWTQNTYKVTFDANGGSISSTDKVVTYDSTYGVLPTPTKTGHTFGGWYLNNTRIENTTIVKTNDNHTLVAEWTVNTYEVTLNANGGTIASGNITSYVYGVGAKLPMDVHKDGYVFAGWYTKNNGQGEFTINVSKTDVNNKAYYAHWVQTATYSVTVDDTSVSVSNRTKSETYSGNTSFDVVVPDELQNMLSTGRLRVRITIGCNASLQYRSNNWDATAVIKVFLGNDSYQEITSITATGGGWPTLYVDPQYGKEVTSNSSISDDFEISSATININMGYQYTVSFTEYKNWAGGTHAVKFSCDLSNVSYSFYVE